MSLAEQHIPQVTVTSSSLGDRLINLLVSPSLVFEEIVDAPARWVNWLVPTLLVCLGGLTLVSVTTDSIAINAALRPLIDSGAIPDKEVQALTAHWKLISAGAVCVLTFVGTLWSALVLWLIGRFFLRSPFAFGKGLELVGLSGVIQALGAVVTVLLVLATGEASARPALSLFLPGAPETEPIKAAAQIFNLFHIWTAAVLAIGLSKISRVSLKESGFWVFGYWLATRLAVVLLS